MCAIFGVQGYLQELILQHTFDKRFAFFVSALQCGTFASLAALQRATATAPGSGRGAKLEAAAAADQWSLRQFCVLLAVLQGVGMACTNCAVQRLSYPTKVIFKSAKPVAVMI